MASRIQGITVEIGGDTTKLSSALSGVNKEIKNIHQPVHGMGGDEERRQLRMGEHFGGCQVCVGRYLRLLRRHLGCHYRKDGFLHSAGQHQHGQRMVQRRSGCAEFLEWDVHHDLQLLGEHSVHGDLRHCCVGKDNALMVNEDGDDMGDIVTPSHWDCMEGRQFSMFFDCLSRHEGRENLYRVTNSKSLTRNEFCLNYTPKDTDTNFSVNVIRLDGVTMMEKEKKAVQVRVHHPLGQTIRKNVCICGDSLVDCNQVATEVYRLLEEDGDCEIGQIGTRGPSNGRHEGRGSWKWKDYLGNTSLAGKTNAFWDAETNRLDFQKYCATNGFDGIDYFLIALGTNDVSQGSTLYRTEAEVQKFVDYAKQFVDKLLDPEVGFPNCKIGIGLCRPGADYSYAAGSSMCIFRKSINTLNLALIKIFDEGKYHPNVTCFAHGLRTNRRLAFPYSNKPATDRFEETSRTLTNSIHPSVRGYQAWADGYYCQIRAWLEEDAAK